MGGREHYSYRNRTRRILLLPFKQSLFLIHFKITSQEVLKAPKVPKVPTSAFRYVWGNPREQSDGCALSPSFWSRVPLIAREDFPSIYVRNLEQRESVEKILNAARTELHRMGSEGGGTIPCLAEETEVSITPGKSCFLMQYPDYWSAVPVRTQRVLQLLTSTWQSHVSL
jgi:hypothetical protein